MAREAEKRLEALKERVRRNDPKAIAEVAAMFIKVRDYDRAAYWYRVASDNGCFPSIAELDRLAIFAKNPGVLEHVRIMQTILPLPGNIQTNPTPFFEYMVQDPRFDIAKRYENLKLLLSLTRHSMRIRDRCIQFILQHPFYLRTEQGREMRKAIFDELRYLRDINNEVKKVFELLEMPFESLMNTETLTHEQARKLAGAGYGKYRGVLHGPQNPELNSAQKDQLGSCYAVGINTSRDFAKAIECFTVAANEGCALAHFHLGVLHEFGKGTPVDIERARECYRNAKIPEADRRLALLDHIQLIPEHSEPAKYQEQYETNRDDDLNVLSNRLGHAKDAEFKKLFGIIRTSKNAEAKDAARTHALEWHPHDPELHYHLAITKGQKAVISFIKENPDVFCGLVISDPFLSEKDRYGYIKLLFDGYCENAIQLNNQHLTLICNKIIREEKSEKSKLVLKAKEVLESIPNSIPSAPSLSMIEEQNAGVSAPSAPLPALLAPEFRSAENAVPEEVPPKDKEEADEPQQAHDLYHQPPSPVTEEELAQNEAHSNSPSPRSIERLPPSADELFEEYRELANINPEAARSRLELAAKLGHTEAQRLIEKPAESPAKLAGKFALHRDAQLNERLAKLREPIKKDKEEADEKSEEESPKKESRKKRLAKRE